MPSSSISTTNAGAVGRGVEEVGLGVPLLIPVVEVDGGDGEVRIGGEQRDGGGLGVERDDAGDAGIGQRRAARGVAGLRRAPPCASLRGRRGRCCPRATATTPRSLLTHSGKVSASAGSHRTSTTAVGPSGSVAPATSVRRTTWRWVGSGSPPVAGSMISSNSRRSPGTSASPASTSVADVDPFGRQQSSSLHVWMAIVVVALRVRRSGASSRTPSSSAPSGVRTPVPAAIVRPVSTSKWRNVRALAPSCIW